MNFQLNFLVDCNHFKKMKKLNFSDFEEIMQLIKLAEIIPGFECNYPVNVELYHSIEFIYRENNKEYLFFVTPMIYKNQVSYYKLYDKMSLLNKDLIAHGTYDNFPHDKYFKLDGGLFFPKEISYDEVVKAMLNIDMGDSYDPQKKFW
jgi:hypothetical protein